MIDHTISLGSCLRTFQTWKSGGNLFHSSGTFNSYSVDLQGLACESQQTSLPNFSIFFSIIFQHLYSCINRNFSMANKKIEEEVPKILKSLKYPFTISKSAMFSIGSLHSWPPLLGALHWMVELIKVCYQSGLWLFIFFLYFLRICCDKRKD